MNHEFKIIITAYNAARWIKSCLSSVTMQNYERYKCLIIDDASTDETFELARSCVKNTDDRFIFIKNTENIKAIANHVKHMSLVCKTDSDIIVSLDGDDTFFGSDVLTYLNELYQNPQLLLTYGQYKTLSDNKIGCNRPIFDIKETRNPMVNFSHLKTFKYLLWKNIKDEDLRRWDGKYVQRAWDSPIVRPAVELAGLDRIKFVEKILYVYNNLNPISEWRLNEAEQLKENDYICSKTRYERL